MELLRFALLFVTSRQNLIISLLSEIFTRSVLISAPSGAGVSGVNEEDSLFRLEVRASS
jgi:hypothetical protein